MLLLYKFWVKNTKEHSASLTSIMSGSLVVSITTIYIYNALIYLTNPVISAYW